MLDIAKIKAHSARIKAIIKGETYVAPVAHVEPVVVPEVIEEVQPEPEVVAPAEPVVINPEN